MYKSEIIENFSIEFKLMLLCAKPSLSDQSSATINSMLNQKVEWNDFLRLVLHHRVYPQVYKNLLYRIHPNIPVAVIETLQRKKKENALDTLRMAGQLARVTQQLEQGGIRSVVLKGLPLAIQLYGDLTLRPSCDLDILIQPEDVSKAGRIIAKQGYVLAHSRLPLTVSKLHYWMKINHHLGYWNQEKWTFLELHWGLGAGLGWLPFAEIEQGLTKVKIAGQPVNVLGAEELFLHLVLHGANHAWFRLKWLCDIAAMVEKGNFSWEGLFDLAEFLNVLPVLGQALILVKELFGAPLPEEIETKVRQDRHAQKLAVRALRFILTMDFDPEELKINMPLYYYFKQYELDLQSGWRRKLGLVRRYLTPSENDFEYLSLPECLYPFYFLLKPWALLRRRFLPVKEDRG